MSGVIWIPGAEHLTPAGSPGTMLGGPPRVVWHTTEAPSGHAPDGRAYFDLMIAVLTAKKAEPHILYDPLTDRLGQFFPLDHSARAVQNDPASDTKTNRTGTACIQIEVVAEAAKPFTHYWQPGPNFCALMAAIRSWGIPDAWPAGRLAANENDRVSRDVTTWRTQAGHYGHAHVPGNLHWDTGAIDQAAVFAAGGDDLDMDRDDLKRAVWEVLGQDDVLSNIATRVLDLPIQDKATGTGYGLADRVAGIDRALYSPIPSKVAGSSYAATVGQYVANSDAYGYQTLQVLSGFKAAIDKLAAAVATNSPVTAAELQSAVADAIKANVVRVEISGKES
ncbi:hypothetical protein [Enterococcus hirae]|uniref:hypothetical protein n=1 Tax=Enterococcus hirae TaxID=1354 RepID=UPI001367E657|nr:hypothetical protein [Enterococcus hirae]NAE18061.1 hypothetical protein [Enterococcus hirae]